MNFLIFSFRGEVAQGAQFALPQVVVQVGLQKSFHVEGSLLAILFLLLFFVKKIAAGGGAGQFAQKFFSCSHFLVFGILLSCPLLLSFVQKI